jgi:hypothetical protein
MVLSLRLALVLGALIPAWVLFALACGGAAAPTPIPTSIINPGNPATGLDAAPTEVPAQLSPTPAVTSPEVIEIEMRGFAFSPAEISVQIGDSISRISFQDDSPQLMGFRGGIYEGKLNADGSAGGIYYEKTREQESWEWTAEGRNSAGDVTRYDYSRTEPPGGTQPMGPVPREVRLERVSVSDPAAGGEAFTFLKPSGWTVEGGVVWRHDLSNLASSAFQVWNPAGVEAIEVFPIVPYTWQEGGVTYFPQGTIYLGSMVQPPIFEPAEFIGQMILPTFRGHLNPRIIDWSETPGVSEEVAAAVQEAGVSKTVRSGRVRVEYSLNGTPVHEVFYVTLVFSQSPLGPFILWAPERLYSFRAEPGELDRVCPLLHTVVSSTQVNRRWLNEYLQVVDLWQRGQLQAIRSAGEISRYIAQVNDEILAITTEAFERQQSTNDRVSRQYSEMIRGVEHYDDPFKSEEVELPAGYDFVWASETGAYILSNDVLLDPNLGSIVNWQLLTGSV